MKNLSDSVLRRLLDKSEASKSIVHARGHDEAGTPLFVVCATGERAARLEQLLRDNGLVCYLETPCDMVIDEDLSGAGGD